jgi:hypothetical protein
MSAPAKLYRYYDAASALLYVNAARMKAEARMNPDTDEPITLRIYPAPLGQWQGRLFAGEEEIGAVDGCDSPEAVEQAAREKGMYPDRVEVY